MPSVTWLPWAVFPDPEFETTIEDGDVWNTPFGVASFTNELLENYALNDDLTIVSSTLPPTIEVEQIDNVSFKLNNAFFIDPIEYDYVLDNEIVTVSQFTDIPDLIDSAARLEPDPVSTKTYTIDLEVSATTLFPTSDTIIFQQTYSITVNNNWDGDIIILKEFVSRGK